jgi:cytochrome d ubiquinol oxidase subunit I
VIFNPVAQAKFVHTVSAGYVTAAVFVLGISAWYMLKKRHLGLARRSMVVAASFGLLSALSVVVLGDESGYTLTDNQKMKLAALEAMWHTEPAPAPLTLVGIPNQEDRTTHFEVKAPALLGLIATRSLDKEVAGIIPLVDKAEGRIRNGMQAYDALQRIQADPKDATARAEFNNNRADLGFALLLKRYVDDPRTATEEMIRKAAWDTVPSVPVAFFSFRAMAGLGFLFIGMFGLAFYFINVKRNPPKWFLRVALLAIPLPWLAAEIGWILAETGRQPWIIDGVLPTFLGVSSLTASQIIITMAGFTLLYGALAVIEIRLMLKAIKAGPGARILPASPGGGRLDGRPAPAAAPSAPQFDQ